MKRSQYQEQKVEQLKKKALTLYRQGLTVREVGGIIGKSHTWVWEAVKEAEGDGGKLSTGRKVDKK